MSTRQMHAKKRKTAPKKDKVRADIMRLYKAVENYVHKCGGSVIVAGGIDIQKWPTDGPYHYTVAVKCLGALPEFAEKDFRS